MSWTIASAVSVGFALGFKHALDADHLAAVATMVSDRRPTLRASSAVGLLWGAGHAAALVAVGSLVVVLDVGFPRRVAGWMELAAGIVLAALGAGLIRRFREGAYLHAHPHEHGPRRHLHPHVHAAGVDPSHEAHDAADEAGAPAVRSHHHLPAAARRLASEASRRRPFFVGIVHGLAGSAALMLLALAAIPGTAARLAYIALFAAGSIGGMVLMSALVGLPFAAARSAAPRTRSGLRLAAGLVSLGVGVVMIWSTARGLGGP